MLAFFFFNHRQKEVCPKDRLIHSRLKRPLSALAVLCLSFSYFCVGARMMFVLVLLLVFLYSAKKNRGREE